MVSIKQTLKFSGSYAFAAWSSSASATFWNKEYFSGGDGPISAEMDVPGGGYC